MAPSPLRPCTTVAALLLAVVAFWLRTNPSAAQQTAPPSTLPAPELTAQAADDAVELTWSTVPGAVRYELWTWWDTETGWQQLGGDDLTATSYSHTGLAAGTAYYYQMRAATDAGEVGVWSHQVSVSLPGDLAAPALTASASASAVDLSWNAVAGAYRYELWTWWDETTGWQQLGGDNLTGAGFSHTGLIAGLTYYYQIRAVNAAGVASPWSQQVSLTVTEDQSSAQTPTPTPPPSPISTSTTAPTATPTATPTDCPTRTGAYRNANAACTPIVTLLVRNRAFRACTLCPGHKWRRRTDLGFSRRRRQLRTVVMDQRWLAAAQWRRLDRHNLPSYRPYRRRRLLLLAARPRPLGRPGSLVPARLRNPDRSPGFRAYANAHTHRYADSNACANAHTFPYPHTD